MSLMNRQERNRLISIRTFDVYTYVCINEEYSELREVDEFKKIFKRSSLSL